MNVKNFETFKYDIWLTFIQLARVEHEVVNSPSWL